MLTQPRLGSARIAEDEKEKGRRRKRKGKGNAAQVEESIHGMDGRAGPKSENVVLQKSECTRFLGSLTLDNLSPPISRDSDTPFFR